MIGVYGGTFDPVHTGHLRTALEVKEALGMQQLRFVPCQIPAHRGKPGASPAQRLAMLQAALTDAPAGMQIDSRELERSGPSFMVDTLSSLREEIGSAVPLSLIVGLDAFRGLHLWHRWESLFELAHVVVMQRPGVDAVWPYELEEVIRRGRRQDSKELHRLPAGLIYFITVTQLDISASQIRQLISERKCARYLTPDSVLDLIEQDRLYR